MDVRMDQLGTNTGAFEADDVTDAEEAVVKTRTRTVNAPKVFTVCEVAKILRLGKMSVYEAVSRGEIPSLRIGRRILIPRNALERMLDNLGSVPKAAA
jgi:excisionase family DNA binding protein